MVIATKMDQTSGRFGSSGIWSVESNALAIFNIYKTVGWWQIGHENGAISMPLLASLQGDLAAAFEPSKFDPASGRHRLA